ncbi:MAG: AarF/ABC1/UbiB kinase family protein [Bacteroidia bacterium]|nr:AarF/ABC1/UbiB kinase family protein [Bacteroidia bacterium]
MLLSIRNIGRIREVISILVKYGFEDIVVNSTLRNFVSEDRRVTWLRDEKPVFEYTRYERIRLAAEELGPTFVKLAQVLSNRPDILPEALIKELEKLQDRVSPFPFEEAKVIIEREMGQPIDEVFDDFNPKPLASASIGQVHRARLKNGDEVVVKVQRPHIYDTIDRDLTILADIVRRADRYLKKQGMNNAQEMVETFTKSMMKELDYRNEARNIDRFRKYYKEYTNFYVPAAYREISTEKVLIIEFARGCKISDAKQLREWGLDPEKIAETGMDIYLTQIFEHGYFHADPHPGNVLVKQDGTICLIDFGMVGQIMPKDKKAFAGIFISMAQKDSREMALNFRRLAIKDEIHDMRAFEYDVNEIIEDFAYLDISESSIADFTLRIQKLMYDYQITIPPSVFLIFRAMAILEGIGKTIHPNFNTYDFIEPYGERMVKDKFKPENILQEATFQFNRVGNFLNTFPGEARGLFQKLQRGKLHFEVELQGYGYLLKKLDSLTNRMSLTLIICSLIIGSAIITTADFPQEAKLQYGIPWLSAMGLFTAAGLGLVLLWAVLRRRKYK